MGGNALSIVRAFLVAQTVLTDVVDQRVYAPRLPEGATLPAVGFFIRGGVSNPHIPPIAEPSYQFDCWGSTAIEARSVYNALYEALQGVQQEIVTVGAADYRILSAVEEVSGQDIQDVEHTGYHRVVTFFRLQVQIQEV